MSNSNRSENLAQKVSAPSNSCDEISVDQVCIYTICALGQHIPDNGEYQRVFFSTRG